jgi:tyrosinase
MSRPVYEDSGTAIEVDPLSGLPDSQPRGFRNRLERGRRMHNYGHGWVGGHMGNQNTSPNDLIFFMHHCNIDRLWAEWQDHGHQGAPFYPGPQSGEDEGHKLNDAMWPWIGSRAGYVPRRLPADSPIPDFTAESERTPADLLDHQSLGYAYN